MLIGIAEQGTIFGELQMVIPNQADYQLESQQHTSAITITKE